MKARLLNGKDFAGFYTGYFLNQNKDLKINGDLVSTWSVYDVITPEIQENEKLGAIYFDESQRVFTYPIEEKTQQEIESYNQSLIPKTLSQRQLRTQLVFNGFDLNSIQLAIDSLPEPNKSIAQIAWDYAVTFERRDSLLIALSGALGISEIQLDEIFINASKL